MCFICYFSGWAGPLGCPREPPNPLKMLHIGIWCAFKERFLSLLKKLQKARFKPPPEPPGRLREPPSLTDLLPNCSQTDSKSSPNGFKTVSKLVLEAFQGPNLILGSFAQDILPQFGLPRDFKQHIKSMIF